MYSFFSGTVIDIEGSSLSLRPDGMGIAFEIAISPHTLSHILIGAHIDLWIYHHITEVSESLFGFLEKDEKHLFRQLLKVNGIGGRTALQLLGLGTEVLLRAIELEDDVLLATVPGIGKKTAQKIIVDLKGSIDFSKKVSREPPVKYHPSTITLISSLVAMGYDKMRVEAVVAALDPNLTIERQTIEAIRQLS